MLDLASGLPYFWIRNGLPHAYDTLHADHRCEVLVIGAGITGALCAHACARAGMDVTVVDARAVGTGSTAASTALLQYEIDVPLHELRTRVGERRAARAYTLGVEAVDGLTELCTRPGHATVTARRSLQFASRPSHARALEREHAARRAIGIPVQLLAREEVEHFIPGVKAVGLLSEQAAETDPYALTHGLLQEVVRLGGRVLDRVTVTGLRREKREHGVTTQAGHRIRARHVLLCTGYESQHYLRRPVMQLHSTYALASERAADGRWWNEDLLIWESARPYLYLRTTPDRRAIIGGLDEPFRDPSRRDALLGRKTRLLHKRFQRLFPQLPFAPEYAWCGTFGSTPDGLPYIDRDPRLGAWFVLGMGGNGITFSFIGARLVRNALLGRHDPDADLFRFDR